MFLVLLLQRVFGASLQNAKDDANFSSTLSYRLFYVTALPRGYPKIRG